MPRLSLIAPITLGACLLLGGCQQYRIAVEVAADGSGRRTVEIERDSEADADASHLMDLAGQGFESFVETGADGEQRHLYRRSRTVADLEGWPATGGLLLRGEAGGSVRLLSEVTVERPDGADGDRLVYRETLRWENLVETFADHAAQTVGAWLRGLRPALPETTVAELRGVMAGAVARSLADFGADPQRAEAVEEWFAGELGGLVADRLRRSGLAPARVRAIVDELQDVDPMSGIEGALPGFDLALVTGFELRVTMPGPIAGGNADIVDGDVAVWKIDLARTIGSPWTMTAESGP